MGYSQALKEYLKIRRKAVKCGMSHTVIKLADIRVDKGIFCRAKSVKIGDPYRKRAVREVLSGTDIITDALNIDSRKTSNLDVLLS